MDIVSASPVVGKTLELPSKSVEIFNEPTDDASLVALVKSIDPVNGETSLATMKAGIVLPEGALAKLSDDELATYAGKLLAFIKVLVRAIFLYSTDEQFVRLFTPTARLLRALHRELTTPIEGQMGGAAGGADFETWSEDFLPKGGMRGGVGEESNAAAQPQVTAQTLQLAQALQSGQLALESQKQQLDVQKLQAEMLQLHLTNVAASTRTQVTRADLAKRILQQADPTAPWVMTLNAVLYSVVIEGGLVATVHYAGKGVGGLGLMLTIVVIEVYTAWTSFSVKDSMSKMGGAIGAGTFALAAGTIGGLTNGVTNLFGYGDVIKSDEKEEVIGPVPIGQRTELKYLEKTKLWAERIDFFLGEMGKTLFGETDPEVAQAFKLCFVGIVFFVLFYFVRHLLDVMEEARIKRKVDLANNTQFNQQVNAGTLPPMLAMAANPAPMAAAPALLTTTTLLPNTPMAPLAPMLGNAPAMPMLGDTTQSGTGKKKRRTFRNRKAKKTKTRAVAFRY